MSGQAPLAPLAAPRSLAEDAADRIREQILSGGFSQGEHLVEAKIAEQLAISRGPVREAFKLLRAEGLLKEEPRRGTFVVSLTADDVREIYGLRAALEGRAARLLAARRDKAAVARSPSRVGRRRSTPPSHAGDAAAVSRADLAFHHGLCEPCGNSRILEVFDRYVPMLRALLRLDELVFGPSATSRPQHRPLLDAHRGRATRTRRPARSQSIAEQAGELIAERRRGQRAADRLRPPRC